MKQILLVEGKDDQHVIWSLCKKFDLPETFEVRDSDGVDNLFVQLPVRLKAAKDGEKIGVIIDADVDLNSRWNQVMSIFKAKLSAFPANPDPKGTIHEQDNIKVGVWIMPNNTLDGMLEDFIKFLIPDDDVLLPVVEKHLEGIEEAGMNKYHSIHHAKAKISSWLAIQEDPGTPMGLSITKKYLTTDKEQCKSLINWLVRLYT